MNGSSSKSVGEERLIEHLQAETADSLYDDAHFRGLLRSVQASLQLTLADMADELFVSEALCAEWLDGELLPHPNMRELLVKTLVVLAQNRPASADRKWLTESQARAANG